MPWGLTRFHHSGQSHFVTFCCYHRRRLFTTDASRRIFESALERVRRSFRLHVYGYVVMPEHVHLLLSEPQRDTSRRAHPLRHPAQAAPPFAVFEGWELGISGAKLLQKDRLIRVQGTRDHLFDLGSMDETCANSCQASCAPRFWLSC